MSEPYYTLDPYTGLAGETAGLPLSVKQIAL